MKWIKSNGARLEVRDCSEVIYTMTLKAPGSILPIYNNVYTDEEARAILSNLRAKGIYDTVASPDTRK